jgi:hypothetical protein
MTKVKPRYQKRVSVPRETLQSATDEEVFTELMKRVIKKTGGRPVCYFIDAFNDYTQYNINHASNTVFFPPHTTIIKTNKV